MLDRLELLFMLDVAEGLYIELAKSVFGYLGAEPKDQSYREGGGGEGIFHRPGALFFPMNG